MADSDEVRELMMAIAWPPVKDILSSFGEAKMSFIVFSHPASARTEGRRTDRLYPNGLRST